VMVPANHLLLACAYYTARLYYSSKRLALVFKMRPPPFQFHHFQIKSRCAPSRNLDAVLPSIAQCVLVCFRGFVIIDIRGEGTVIAFSLI
jgi:hypothetical protein